MTQLASMAVCPQLGTVDMPEVVLVAQGTLMRIVLLARSSRSRRLWKRSRAGRHRCRCSAVPSSRNLAGSPLVETGRQRFRRTCQECPGGRLQDAETLVGQVPQQEIGVRGNGRQLRLQIAHHVGQEGTTGEGRPQQGQIDVAHVAGRPALMRD